MKLSERLQTIADEIRTGETMADIGTDHGFLPIYLKQSGICPKVILTDVSRGSLNKAMRDCRIYGPEEEFDLRIGDGLSVLRPGEVDNIVIAGMGGILITEILGADPQLSRSFGTYILQPRNNLGRLRFWLAENGYERIREHIVREGRFLPVIMTVRPGETADRHDRYEDAPELWDYPDSMLRDRNPYSREYLEAERERQQRILNAISAGDGEDQIQEQKAVRRLRRIGDLLREMN
ncbi:tRNA (adenine(22)-N(1))-methyltransferase [Hornefia butyriciproducens]|uniref:tRNA (adenine(22)-N(1))-methyltransferase n=1 Tax=Hornefia butyriciproducens TaxID=2652293 RepID=UPI002A91296E|nr:class I SAM-dependent methyltransferase [Hornefia butyriciproducens]MCI7412689.1 class I SAM-dependent methyltransferase [Clostridiales bacterium]MDY5463418.1 class I SAM-dependent methyltransferase [Hornefia butyriciproducens]MDY6211503.1 class I SAM-dependent methyltransferase [Hornefia butyriciproducens]